MRSLVTVMLLFRLACRPVPQWAVTAFVRPAVVVVPQQYRAAAATAKTTQRWMGTQQEQQQEVQERTPEEMERIKAEREERK